MASPSFQLRTAFATVDPFDPNPVWTDHSTDLIDAMCNRGRQRELDRCDTGNLTATVDNSSWQYVPGYTSALYSPYLIPGRRIQLNVTVAGKASTLFDGYVNRYEIDWNDPNLSTARIIATDALALFANTPLQASFPQQLTGARIAAILSTIGWPAARTNIAKTVLTCPARAWVATDNQTAGNALNQTADTEPGTLYADGYGNVNFNPGFTTGSTGATLGDRGDLGEVWFDACTLTVNDDAVWNELHGTRDGGTGEVIVSSSTSFAEFRKRQLQKNTFNINDTGLQAALGAFLTRYQFPAQLFDPIQVVPAGDANSAFAFCCSCEIGKTVQFNRTPPVSTSLPRFQQACVINWLQHEIKPGTGQEWTTTLRLAGAQVH